MLFYKSEDYAPAAQCDVLTVLHTTRLNDRPVFLEAVCLPGDYGPVVSVTLFS